MSAIFNLPDKKSNFVIVQAAFFYTPTTVKTSAASNTPKHYFAAMGHFSRILSAATLFVTMLLSCPAFAQDGTHHPIATAASDDGSVTVYAGNDIAQRRVREGKGENRYTVGLVLSGGGAKGVAHIGILKVLEEANIPIDYIAGTSMGAIIGGLYSIGWSTQELDSLVRTQDWPALLSDKIARRDKLLSEKEIADKYIVSVPIALNKKFSIPSGVLAGQSVLNLLNEMTLGYHDDDLNFDSLPIPFACVTYDMVAGKEVVYRSGNLPIAIRASMSIPGAFAPVLRDSMVLVDGGIYNNFPVDVVREMGADIVIGVDLAGNPKDIEGLSSMMGLIDQITAILGREQYRKNLQDVDLYLKPNIVPYTSSSFNAEAVDSLLIRGERCARQNWDKIIALREVIYSGDKYVVQKERKLPSDNDAFHIGEIKFVGMTKNEEVFLRPAIGIKENTVVTKERINNAISKLRGSGAFSYVTYTLEGRPPYTLTISVDEKQEAIATVGFRFDSEEMASILIGTTLTMRGLQGPKLGLAVRLNENPYLKLNFTSSNILHGRLGLSYMLKSNNYQLYKKGKSVNNISFVQNRVELFFSLANPTMFNPKIGCSYEHFNYDSFLFASDDDRIAVKPTGFINYFVSGSLETLNDHYFPTSGVSMDVLAALHTDNGYKYKGNAPFGSVEYHGLWAISATKRLTFIPEIYGRTLIGNSVAYSYYNYVGGEVAGRYMDQQIPFVGIRHVEAASRSILAASLEVRMRLFVRHFISLECAYGIQNDNFFRMFTQSRNNLFGLGLKYSYNSPIGPISILFDASNINRSLGVYFSLGKTF